MNPFTRHPRRQGVGYGKHGRFAIGIAGRLSKSAAALALHALLPFVSMPRELDLEATAAFLLERNRWIESAAANGDSSGAADEDRVPDTFFVEG